MNTASISTRETLSHELEDTRLAYHELLAAIPKGGWDLPTVNPAWNVRQMMFHITLALRFLPGDIAFLRRGVSPPVPVGLFNRLNEWYTRWAGQRQSRAGLAAEYDRQHNRVLALLETIEPDEWTLRGSYPYINENLHGTRTLAEMFHYITVHFEEHAANIREGLQAPETVSTAAPEPRRPPTGLGRFFFRAPLALYRVGLGWLLGNRFLLLHHVGRKSGLPRQAMLEVVDHDRATDTYYVASGFGRSSQWFQNVQAHPDVEIQVGRRRLAVTADVLDAEASGQRMVEYARQHPVAAQNLARVLGLEVDGTEAGYRQAGQQVLPFMALRPRQVLREWPTAKELAAPLLGLALVAGLVAWWRRR